ncbi:hypothetical protein AB431_09855 [Mycobacterium sp. EPa45]|nr:hypothetical protein AB431_09855 [Mycobacterium sp. EPa45]
MMRELDDGGIHLGPLGQIAREGDDVTAGARNPRLGADRCVSAALGQQEKPQAGARAEGGGEQLGVGVGEFAHCRNAKIGKLFRGLRSYAPQGVDRAGTHLFHPVGVGERVDTVGLAEAGRDLGALLVVADAHRADQPGLGGDHGPDPLGELDRVGDVGADVRLVPAPYLHGMTEIAQQTHHLIGGLIVGRRVGRQERRVRALAGRAAQRHPGVHAEAAGLIRCARHHLAWLGGIATATNDHG